VSLKEETEMLSGRGHKWKSLGTAHWQQQGREVRKKKVTSGKGPQNI